MCVETECVTSFADVIHTVGPQGEKPDKLESCYRTSLEMLIASKLRSVVRYSLCVKFDE
jgi:hypothetical protein